jgi:hypothetical protein
MSLTAGSSEMLINFLPDCNVSNPRTVKVFSKRVGEVRVFVLIYTMMTYLHRHEFVYELYL